MLEVVHSARKYKSGMLSYMYMYGAGLEVIAYDRAANPCGHDHNGYRNIAWPVNGETTRNDSTRGQLRTDLAGSL